MYSKILYLLLLFNLSSFAIPPKLQTEFDKRAGDKFDILCDFDFENTTYEKLSPKWIPIKGKYEVLKGKLEGRELVEDKHVSTSGMDLDIGHSAVVYFEVQLHQANNVIVTLNGKGKGHICRVILTPNFLKVQSDCKPKGVYEIRKQKHLIDKYYKVLLELNHDQLTARVLNAENSVPLSIKHDYINWPIDNIRWAVSKGPARIDNLCVLKLKK
jgi:hypothetical protein